MLNRELIKSHVSINIEYQGMIKRFGFDNIHIATMLKDIEECLNEIARDELVEITSELIEGLENE